MDLHSEAPPLTGSIVRNGGNGISESSMPEIYRTNAFDAKDFAVSVIAVRWRLTLPLSRVVCELAHLGGRAL